MKNYLIFFKEHINDPENHSGFLGWFIRNQRSRNPMITTRSYKRKLEDEAEVNDDVNLDCDDNENTICYLKHKFINTEEDRQDIIKAMTKSQQNRLKWIKNDSPTLTDILERYPKYLEIHFLVRFLFLLTYLIHNLNNSIFKFKH